MSNVDLTLFPVLQKILQMDNNEVVLELFIPEDLAYLNGHFDQIAIVPGVTQIQWAVYYAQQHIDKLVDAHPKTSALPTEQTLKDGFYEMQVIKFKSLIFPKTTIQLSLRLVDDSSKLYFRFHSDTQEFSSGRLYFKGLN
jgi:3-hydroxymyristoyl/3-hydroxydecanoyl-(acyl carrier protein) dehydratase